MTQLSVAERPTERVFYDPVIYLIGKLSGWKPYVGVPHLQIRDDVLRLAGIDPANSPWPLKDSSKTSKDGLYRRVHFAWYHQTRKYRVVDRALCARPIKGKRGDWALTELGVKRAKQLREEFEGRIILSAEPNVTAQFLTTDFPKLYSRLTSYLSRKMPKSASHDKVEDHAQTWLERIISRNGLRKRLEQGRRPAPSQMCAWARRSAYTDIRNEGREPVCRVFHGALTKAEIPLYDSSKWTETVVPRGINDSELLQGNRYADHSEEDETAGSAIDLLVDETNLERELVESDSFDFVLNRLSAVIHDAIPADSNPQWYVDLMVDRFVNEMSVRECAEARGISENERSKVTNGIDKIRSIMISSREEGGFADLIR